MKFVLNHDRKQVLQMVVQAPDGHTVEIKPRNRTIDQNRKYWAELGWLAEKHGHTAEVWHQYFKQRFCKEEAKEVMGEVVWIPPSTSKMTRQEFTDYLEQVFAWIAENVSE